MRYEWDEDKNKKNIRTHGVGFPEAAEALEDPDAIEMYDEEHSSADEDRYICIGAARRSLLLMVVYTDRFGNARIISARHADSRERRLYIDRLREKDR